MPPSICGICDLIRNCNAQISDKQSFMTDTIALLCNVSDNSAAFASSGTVVENGITYNLPGLITPVSKVDTWHTVVAAAAVNVSDGATVTNATALSTVTHPIFAPAAGAGTNLLLSLMYAANIVGPIPPTVKVFGRTGTDDWRVVKSKGGPISVPVAMSLTTDAINNAGTFKFTTPDINVTGWDVIGYHQVIVAIEIPLSATSGTVNTAVLQGRII